MGPRRTVVGLVGPVGESSHDRSYRMKNDGGVCFWGPPKASRIQELLWGPLCMQERRKDKTNAEERESSSVLGCRGAPALQPVSPRL